MICRHTTTHGGDIRIWTYEEILNIITEGLDAENKVKITGFGTFKKLNKKSRMGRNPKTGKVYEIKARNTVSFYPSKKTKNLING